MQIIHKILRAVMSTQLFFHLKQTNQCNELLMIRALLLWVELLRIRLVAASLGEVVPFIL